MKFTAEQIAGILEGTVEGNSAVEVFQLAKIEEGTKGSLTFLSNPKYEPFIYSTQASIAIVNDTFIPQQAVQCTLIRVKDAYAAFTRLLEFYNEVKLHKSGIEQPSFISESARVGENAYIGAFAYIGQNVVLGDNVKIYPHCYIGDNVTIGENTTLFSGCKIYSETTIGKNVNIHANTVIGSDGFGFAPTADGSYRKIPQIGNVVIEDNVDIGACTTIDRATMGSTVIRSGVKLDNHIQIAHNVEVGEHTVIAAQAGVAGSSKIGKHAMIGGQVGVSGHLHLGDHVRVQAQSGISKNLKEGEAVQGSPAFGYSDYNKAYVHFRNLSKLAKDVQELKKITNQKTEL